MKCSSSVFFFALLGCIFAVNGLNLETLRYCCSLGTNYAESNLDCANFQTPIAGIVKEEESLCLNSIEVCCKKQDQERQCNKGIEDARGGTNCGKIDAQFGFQKQCCEACELGRETGKSQQTCQGTLGLGQPYDQAFSDCCEVVINESSASPSALLSSSAPTQQTPVPSEAQKSSTVSNSLPPLENVCDIGDVCAQICIPTSDSYRCDCNKGFTLMADGVSCKPDKRSNKKSDRCHQNNPCDHFCRDTGVAVKCSCREGYELQSNKRSCKDIDECALGTHDCEGNEECVNDEGTYYCEDPNFSEGADDFDSKCPTGYKFNYDKLLCDDIDECEFDIICPRPKTCINTIGSFRCEGEDRLQCPPGFQYKSSIDTCADIDECISGENDCNKESQVCLNTKGNYTCVDKVSKKTCPPGFKKNPYTQNCDDINECEENDSLCAYNEECVNELGGHTCIQTSKPRELPPQLRTTATSTTTSTTTTTTTQRPSTSSTPPPKPVSCPKGYKYVYDSNSCADIDECREDERACDSNQDCYNTMGSFVCNCKTGFTKDYQTGACIDINECQVGIHDCTVAQRCDNTIGSYLCARITGCGTGYTLNYANGLCEDDDECALGTHSCADYGPNFKCRNTLGSYRCDAVRKPPKVYESPTVPTNVYEPPPKPQERLPIANGAPPRIYEPPPRVYEPPPRVYEPLPKANEAPPRIYEPPPRAYEPPPRVYESLPKANETPPRVYEPPPRVYESPTTPTPSSTSTSKAITYPLLSGTLKKCLPGYIMNERGVCEDINECASNPCAKGHKCLNLNGRYQCISSIQCKIGYELDESGESCVDVNECTRGSHKCNHSQICKNGLGYYTCECPPGHHLNPSNHLCEDIDECKFYRVCSAHADCINTVGSYKCHCKEGFKEVGNSCQDIDECFESSRLCEHSCVNIWGSYRCACKRGFTLNFDNRTCTDIDECDKFKDKRLCIGTCENIPGSYRCQCPRGYRLGSDGRTCIDIDECEQNVCPRPDDVCLNTRGAHRCFTITCPTNYIRDPQHKGRCKRPPTLCDPRDTQCIMMPEQYTFHYITLVSNLPVNDGSIQFFQINGPKWIVSRAEFSMNVVNVNCPVGVERVNERFFKMIKPAHNVMQLYLARSIAGPQEIELKVEMKLYQSNQLSTTVVSQIYIIVSEYPF